MSETLLEIARSLPGDNISLRELLERMGEEGMLATCIFLCLPFLIPVSIPGISTVFGLLVILMAIGIALNRVPWLPRRLLERRFSNAQLSQLLERGAGIFLRIERWIQPRWMLLSTGTLANTINAMGLLVGGILLMMPFGFILFSNTLPGLAIMLLAIGMLHRDGWAILAGYAAMLGTMIYFSALLAAVWMAGAGLWSQIFKTG